MLRASSVGCWPAQSQECRAMLIRAMSSRVKGALSPTRPTHPLDGSAGESSGNGRVNTKGEKGTSSDHTAEKDHARTSTHAAKIRHVCKREKWGTLKFGRLRGGALNSHGAVLPAAFVLPPPALRSFPSPGLLSKKAAHKKVPKLSERIRRVAQKQPFKSILPADIESPVVVLHPSLQKPPASMKSVNGKLARKDSVSHQDPPVPLNGKLTTSTPPKKPETLTCQTVAKLRTKAVESTSSTAKAHEGKTKTLTRQAVTKVPTKTVVSNSAARTRQEENLYITTESPHHVGRTWRPLPIKPIKVLPLPPLFSGNDQVQRSWSTLHETASADDAWNALTTLDESSVPVPPAILHRIVRLVARARPRASTEYTRLLEILTRIWSVGEEVYVHEWNALIDAAGRGWRKTTVRHYEMALSFFRDMTRGRAPGVTLALDSGSDPVEDEVIVDAVAPDIYTYTTLLGIAARTENQRCLRHARMLLERSGTPPNRFSHLALMTYFSNTSQLGAVRSTLILLEGDKMELGLDGINGLLTAYSKNRRLDIVTMLYRLLKHNLTPDLDNIQDETRRLEDYRRQLRTEEFFDVPDYLVPNEVTYTHLIQIMAYHGHLSTALTIFNDMLTALNTERGAPLTRDADGVLKPSTYQPTRAIFRALFLGFARHGVNPHENGAAPRPKRPENSPNEWTLSNLQQVLGLFMNMPQDWKLGVSAFYWLIVGLQTVSGNDRELIRDVWKRVEGRFRSPRGRLRRMKASLFPEET